MFLTTFYHKDVKIGDRREGEYLLAERFVLLLLAISILLVVIPTVFAGSSAVFSEEKAGGYKYSISREGIDYTWTVVHKGNKSVIKETEKNSEDLNHYKQAVRDIKIHFIKIGTYASGFLILTIVTIILHAKNKLKFKNGGAIVFLFAVIALCNTFVASTELDRAYSDARYYYYLIIEQKGS